MSLIRIRLTAVVLVAAFAVAACSAGSIATPPPPSGAPSGPASAPPTPAPIKLTVGLGYIPSVQFAPFYQAQQAGYYAAAGLQVEFQNKVDPDLITLVGQGAIDVGIGDGTSVIPAVSQGIPIRYVATIYGQFPNVVFAKASSGIAKAADLKGRKVGTPGRYGSSWIMLQALLGSAGLTTSDIQVVEYPDYTQRAAVEHGAVDAATGFSNNEPVQLELDGAQAVVLHIDAITPLPGPGLIAGTATIGTKHDAIVAFVAATLRAMGEIKGNPKVGLDAAIAAVPELASARDAQMAILTATIDSWTGPIQAANGLGTIDRAGWTQSISYLTSLGLVPNPVAVDDLVQADLLPAGG
ncbi:MAG: putative riboflavin transport system substrate-binding protein [Chloroflexota bacterium]|nr:putative riboflavin transport system substrate-binding protein [Chloroflexota bacterium]